MTLIIAGRVIDPEGTALVGVNVQITFDNAAAFADLAGAWDTQGRYGLSIPTDTFGAWSWPVPFSAIDPTDATCSITLPNGVRWSGILPLSHNGTLSLKDLKDSYSWGLVSAPSASVVAVQGPAGASLPSIANGPIPPSLLGVTPDPTYNPIHTYVSGDVTTNGSWYGGGAVAFIPWTPTRSGTVLLLPPDLDGQDSVDYYVFTGTQIGVNVPSRDGTGASPAAIADAGSYYQGTFPSGTAVGTSATFAVTAGTVYTLAVARTGSPVGLTALLLNWVRSTQPFGGQSIIVPWGPVASGLYAIAESQGTASGQSAHAEGDATASGTQAHAEGGSTATGLSAHAEGTGTASGLRSHAEGGSAASGTDAHAEGNATASGAQTHAEGFGTASAAGAHAEGGTSHATGQYSHAEGTSTASGSTSHAEGDDTTASGDVSHSAGHHTLAEGQYSDAGGRHSYARLPHEYAHASGAFVSNPGNGGDAQYSRLEAFIRTTDATPTALQIGYGVDADLGNSVLTVPDGHTWHVLAQVAASREDVAGTVAGFQLSGVVSSAGGSLRVVGTVDVAQKNDADASAWLATLAVSESQLNVTVTGDAAKTIRWHGVVHLSQVGLLPG